MPLREVDNAISYGPTQYDLQSGRTITRKALKSIALLP